MEVKIDSQKIKQLRLDRSWSQEKLAERADVSLRTVQRMEMDGSASLKSRLAVAEALGVEPSFLDPATRESESQNPMHDMVEGMVEGMVEKEDADTGRFFSYPGPTRFANKIRTPLLAFLWVSMVITGGLVLVVSIPLVVTNLLYGDNPAELFTQLMIAQVPLFLIFLLSIGLYSFFRSRTPIPDN